MKVGGRVFFLLKNKIIPFTKRWGEPPLILIQGFFRKKNLTENVIKDS
jgi:hypothetical protein